MFTVQQVGEIQDIVSFGRIRMVIADDTEVHDFITHHRRGCRATIRKLPHEDIIAGATRQFVCARAPGQMIIAGPAIDDVIALLTVNGVVASPAADGVITAAATAFAADFIGIVADVVQGILAPPAGVALVDALPLFQPLEDFPAGPRRRSQTCWRKPPV